MSRSQEDLKSATDINLVEHVYSNDHSGSLISPPLNVHTLNKYESPKTAQLSGTRIGHADTLMSPKEVNMIGQDDVESGRGTLRGIDLVMNVRSETVS